MAGLFNIGLSGLRAQQSALAVTGQNITNASTPGYSRQRVEIEVQNVGFRGGDFEGAGARVERITRVANEFASNQIRLDNSLFSELDALSRQINQIEGVLLNESGGLDSALQGFFGALQLASTNPESLPARQLVLSEANALATRFQSIHERLNDQYNNVDSVLISAGERINEISSSLAEINSRVASLSGSDASGASNTLLDQRDELLRELSGLVSVSMNKQQDGQINVFIGKGQALVLGAIASQLEITAQGQIAMRADDRGERVIVTDALLGGEIGGALEFREGVLDNTLNQLGRIAHAITQATNEVHAQGIDLAGSAGVELFQNLNTPQKAQLRVVGAEDNHGTLSGSISLTVDDPFNAPVSDYELVFDEKTPGTFFIRRLTDNNVVFQGTLSDQSSQRVSFDEMTLELSGNDYVPGDRYVLKPFADGAASFGVAIKDPALLALAGPMRIESAFGNRGTGDVILGEIFDTTHPLFGADGSLTPPLMVRFTSPTTYEILDATDPANPVPLDPPFGNQNYDPTAHNELLPGSLGQTRVQFNGTDINALPNGATILAGPGVLSNGYDSQIIRLTQTDPVTGTTTLLQSVALAANASAREIAAVLGSTPGLTASAHTELSITDLVSDGLGDPLQIVINGVELGPMNSLNELADAISGNLELQAQGISARSDGETLSLESRFGDDLTVQIAGDPTDRITVLNEAGNSLTINGVGPSGEYRTITVGGRVWTTLAPELELSSDTGSIMQSNPAAARADLGFALNMIGRPETGDVFNIRFNNSGIGDNSNALALANLNVSNLIGKPAVTFGESYAEIVQFVGVRANQAQINRDAASALLEQSVAQRESISGVNLDEEAANLIRYEQAYNASAQIISVARDIFETLFSVIR